MLGVNVGGPAARKKWLEVALPIVPALIGSVAALVLLAARGITIVEVLTFFVSYLLVGLGVGLGLHRHFSHRSFETSATLRFVLGALGSMALQGSIVEWVANHRRHHAHTDEPGDLHSPYVDGRGNPISGLRGLWHAHVGWMFDATTTDLGIYGAGLAEDSLVMFFSRTYWLWAALSLAIPYGIGYLTGGREAAWGVMLVGGCLRASVLHNVIWAVNSFGHIYGRQAYAQGNASKNNSVLMLIALGDGLHNNHHRFPRSAFQAHGSREFDLGGSILRILERLGLIWNVVPRPATE